MVSITPDVRSADDIVLELTDDAPDHDTLRRLDDEHVIHGFMGLAQGAAPGPIFESGRGLWLTDTEGNRWIDACGGQANVNLGYGRDELAEVAGAALRQLSFATHFYHRRGHTAASRLGGKLAEITPGDLNHFFFALGGSDAVETAIKVARFVNIVNGRPEKIHIIGRYKSYHGVTYGAASLTGDPGMWKNIGPLLPGFSHIEQPSDDGAAAAQALEDEILRVGPDKVAAFMAEPISTPNGIVVPPDDYWPRVREICTRYDVLWIADEVLTGFGRTGKMFAVENWGVVPDMMTMSKAITAGSYPLAVLAVNDAVRTALGTGNESFVHGLTAGGHFAACEVALATIDIMERENVIANSLTTSRYFVEQLQGLAERYPVLDRDSARGLGMMIAVDLTAAETVGALDDEQAAAMHARFVDEHLMVRTYRNNRTIGFLPALTTTEADVDAIVERLGAGLQAMTAEGAAQ
jgi:adenosylmethionine-8-amino-7-oxononanoate aminotransferase